MLALSAWVLKDCNADKSYWSVDVFKGESLFEVFSTIHHESIMNYEYSNNSHSRWIQWYSQTNTGYIHLLILYTKINHTMYGWWSRWGAHIGIIIGSIIRLWTDIGSTLVIILLSESRIYPQETQATQQFPTQPSVFCLRFENSSRLKQKTIIKLNINLYVIYLI